MSARSYTDSISDLNSLQSNAATINALRASGKMNQNAIGEMRDWVAKAGVAQSDIDELKVIHIAGTKGKGSTAAMVASILSNYRLAYGKTPRIGLYTSPHLKSVRERIQIDGEPLPKEEWTEYFYDVWDTLDKHGSAKPVYFRFLTILAFHAFRQECVDVVVLECGVGGEHDSTNIISEPVVSGITSLGIDHVHVLGRTIEEIAWHKAGIFKKDCPAFTVEQGEKAMDVLRTRAQAIGVSSFEVIPVTPALSSVKLGLNGDFQRSNASLAIALANEYLKTQGVDENLSVRLPEEFITGLEQVKWPGRCERRQIDNVEWCLDGGHTSESLALTGEWYGSIPESVNRHYLIFNQQSRDSTALLQDLHDSLPNHSEFRKVIFCTNKTYQVSGYSSELTSINNASDAVDALDVQRALARKWHDMTDQEAIVVTSIEEALNVVRDDCGRHASRCLVTGSLHLVGGVMTVLDDKQT
ncbi:protein of unknown function [Taphrina deformans PYCC 5710]|uniref:Folylpolyglutamate synthase n=1 Tax=Taphrina deformans (strain PYCC 5710 / ATCC 11124 / CBS 356.35 / IMI 108563 / JCM 9778 / NBRC 8474) TaxID=1097556 RepID=R4XKI8_TAPDE|nr:protein of unknown function [Taphrina deformans PYCC 5710]|eukprot:CCG84969.1 protein of unknown function [Taphrina deformans PYCC 5710]